jgi:hypothetical protein
MRLLEVSLLGCLYATSRWTLTTTLFTAIKRINLSRGSKTCFYTSNEDSIILRIKRRWVLLFLSSFSWRSNSCKKVYVLYDKDILLVIFSREFLYKFMTWRFHLLHFPLRFLVIFTFWFSRLSSLLFRSLWFIILSFVVFSVSWSFDSILCAFS